MNPLSAFLLTVLLASVSCGVFRMDMLGIESNGTDPLWFKQQKIDHFNQQDTRTWSQRYWVNDEVYKAKGPIFLYICGESTCRGTPKNTSFPYQLAKKAGALIIAVEHRFYGESQPFGKNSMKLESLRYLTVEQALEDLATFIMWFKANSQYKLSDDQKWLAIGGSYPGALSAWFRSKYPHLIAGSWASSAVVNAILNFDEFDYHIYYATSLSGPECPATINNLTKYFETQIYANESYKAEFGQDALKLSNDELLWYIADSFSLLVQYGKRVDMCNQLKNHTDFNDLVNKTIHTLLESNSVKMYSAYWVSNDTLSEKNGDDTGRQWNYQTCTQVGWFQPQYRNSKQTMRTSRLNLNFFKEFCRKAYGAQLWPNVDAFNWKYGGVGLEASNVASLNGSEDPWQWATKNTTTGSIVAMYANCDRCGHCVDMKGANDTDPNYPASLKQLHDKLEGLILGYVGQDNVEMIEA